MTTFTMGWWALGQLRSWTDLFFLNQDGEIVEVFNQFGKKVDTKLTHPEYCLFADETRCNTLMKKDGHVGGTKYITEQGT